MTDALRRYLSSVEYWSDGRPIHVVPDPETGENKPASVRQWGEFMENTDAPGRIVCSDHVRASIDTSDVIHVSTVHLGMDHSYGDGPPLYWETMIFGGAHDQYQDRYASLAEAQAGHVYALKLARRWSWLPLHTQSIVADWRESLWWWRWRVSSLSAAARKLYQRVQTRLWRLRGGARFAWLKGFEDWGDL